VISASSAGFTGAQRGLGFGEAGPTSRASFQGNEMVSRNKLPVITGHGALFVWVSAAFLLVYTSWVWAGLRPSLHVVAVFAAVLLLVGLTIGGQRAGRTALVRDPFFWTGLAFLGYLCLQCLNTGRTLYFDVGYQQWSLMPPRWPGWPWAFDRSEAFQMLTWFFPGWTIALAIRSPLLDRRAVHRLLSLVVYSSGLLALFGLIQFATRTKSIYGLSPLECEFFASFAYANHAAAYFVLTGALAAGLLYREVFQAADRPDMSRSAWAADQPWKAAGLAAVLLLCLTGANLSLSRAGVILAWALACFVAGYGLIRGWRVLPPAGRVTFAAVAVAVAGLFYFAVAGFGDKAICEQFTPVVAGGDSGPLILGKFGLSLGHRPLFARAAISMWRDYPWFGVGGWGYRHLVANHVPPETWEDLMRSGWANVHNDTLQFLVEFGIVGFGLIVAALASLAIPAFHHIGRNRAQWTMSMLGLALVVVFSMVDLPFRCPAILTMWLFVLAAMPKMCEFGKESDR